MPDERQIFIEQYFNFSTHQNQISQQEEQSISDLDYLKDKLKSKHITIISEKTVSIFDIQFEEDGLMLEAFKFLIPQQKASQQKPQKQKHKFSLFKKKEK